MSDNIKLIIEIPKEDYKKLVNPYQHNEIWCERLKRIVINGTPLDSVKAEIEALSNANPSYWHSGDMVEREEVLEIIDSIGKGTANES